jgi:hypothetical protein
MSKTTCSYWNPLHGEQQHRWQWLDGLEGQRDMAGNRPLRQPPARRGAWPLPQR